MFRPSLGVAPWPYDTSFGPLFSSNTLTTHRSTHTVQVMKSWRHCTLHVWTKCPDQSMHQNLLKQKHCGPWIHLRSSAAAEAAAAAVAKTGAVAVLLAKTWVSACAVQQKNLPRCHAQLGLILLLLLLLLLLLFPPLSLSLLLPIRAFLLLLPTWFCTVHDQCTQRYDQIHTTGRRHPNEKFSLQQTQGKRTPGSDRGQTQVKTQWGSFSPLSWIRWNPPTQPTVFWSGQLTRSQPCIH